MTKEQNFPHPPAGHFGLLAYDSVNDRWQVVHVDASGNLQVDLVAAALPSGAATEAKQLADGHNVAVSNPISGFATEAKQLADGHNVAVSNPISGFATEAKQLADGHNVAVSNPISGFATEAKQLADGHNVTVDNTDLTVKQSTPADLFVAQHQYDGSTWRKSNLLWGYNAPWRQKVEGTASGGGHALATTTAVASGYVYVLEGFQVEHNAGVDKDTQVYISGSSVIVTILNVEATGSGVVRFWNGKLLMAYGDVVSAYAFAPGDGKKVYLAVWGYKMKIDM